jgi:hypothetical protein
MMRSIAGIDLNYAEKNMKKKLSLLIAILLCLGAAAPTANALRLNIEIGDRGYYLRGPGYWDGGVYYVWVPGHWGWRHHHRVWIHGHYRPR